MQNPTHAAVVRKLTAAGLTIHEAKTTRTSVLDGRPYTERRYWADTKTDRISWLLFNDDVRLANALYVKPHGQEDDLMTDYFAGTFTKKIDLALQLAS